MSKHQGTTAIEAVSRSLARLNNFFVWWGDHRGWPASEPARVPLRHTLRSRKDR